MKFRSVLRGMVVPACAVAGLVMAAAPSVAAPAPVGQHCVANIVTGVQKCYSSEADAAKFGTGERVATVPLVTFYDGYNKGPSSYTARGPRACSTSTTDYDYSHPNMANFGWNDRASSVVTFNHCDIWFSSDKNYEGECGNRWIDSSMDLRVQSCNNRASSYDLS